MAITRSTTPVWAVAGMAVLLATAGGFAQQPGAPAPPAQGAGAAAPGGGRGGGGRGGGGGVAGGLFTAIDTNRDASLTRDEVKTTFDKWYTSWDKAKTNALTAEQVQAGLAASMSAQQTMPLPADLEKMMAALPDKAYATPARARKVLVLAKAGGFVHSSIPLAAKTVEALGTKTGAWATTITFDPADINTENLKQYDAVFLDSTTGAFLDDPNDAAATAARRAALLAFVRGGKGLAGIHAATDSYHMTQPDPNAPAPARGGGGGGFGGGGRGGGAATSIAPVIMEKADKNADQKLSRQEFAALGDAWYDTVDPDKTGKVAQADFVARFAAVIPPPPPPPAPAAPVAGAAPAGVGSAIFPVVGGLGNGGPARQQVGTWPEFNNMIGCFFKFHWLDPQLITTKVDDPKSPLTQMFNGQDFEVRDETYTCAQDSFSRTNVHVLTSINYDKMSPEDKAKEPAGDKRTDGDYGLSWIKREGNGRVFYEAHGHSERIYAMPNMLQHLLAGIQYAVGDLKADDSPSVKK